ncbi:MAG TPA: cytochrome P450, partial [Solirubrobacterales bacterium]
MSLPPEARSSPLVQTLRWALRPLAFMSDCRDRYGDAFSVRFLGFERPMVLISDPAAIKALYMERSHGLPPGRDIILKPILGSNSVLLLDEVQHMRQRKLMLPPFHGERMQSYGDTIRDVTERRMAEWPSGKPFELQ